MPKFITYQRPAPVNKQSWGGRQSSNAYPPIRRPAAHPAPGLQKLPPPQLPGPPRSQ
ncbi:hypothetical protein [Devosia sp. A16]|uniref:hypothetical protein n=1 Tax=Devosia sp. A16 TaxID=1736675 RepID=UPI000A7983E9|nr:hypothetical protein [Devosia sp. A16]